MTTDTEIPADLQIDAFEYARRYRELKTLGDRIEKASKTTGLSKIVFFDGIEHFTLSAPYGNELLKLYTLQCVVEGEHAE